MSRTYEKKRAERARSGTPRHGAVGLRQNQPARMTRPACAQGRAVVRARMAWPQEVSLYKILYLGGGRPFVSQYSAPRPVIRRLKPYNMMQERCDTHGSARDTIQRARSMGPGSRYNFYIVTGGDLWCRDTT